MATRPVRFEIHIRPLMRLIDRDNMLWAFDLWDYDHVRSHADNILQRLRVDMPPNAYGGPWPEESIALFERWMNEGFLRLDLGVVDANGYKAVRQNGRVTVSGRGTTPASGYRAWLEGSQEGSDARTFTLYWEPPVPSGDPTPGLFRARASFDAPLTATNVAVIDAAGRHNVVIQDTPSIVAPAQPQAVQAALTAMSAANVTTRPLAQGTVTQCRIADTDVELFENGGIVDCAAPAHIIQRLEEALNAAQQAETKPSKAS